MFSVNGTTITLSRGDTGALLIKANAKKWDGSDFEFAEEDRAVFSIKSGNTLVKEKYAPLAEQLNLKVNAVERATPITAALNETTFKTNVENSCVVQLTYNGSAWTSSPSQTSPLTYYGVTVTGTPVAGDSITITYIAYPFDDPNTFAVVFYNHDTDQLTAGNYSWDVRYVIHPYYDETGRIVDGNQVITPILPMGMTLLTVVGEI